MLVLFSFCLIKYFLSDNFLIFWLNFKANAEKEHYKAEKLSADQRFEDVLNEFNEKIRKEKEIVLENVENEIKSLTEQVMFVYF
jgi:hypothetical protein